MVKENHPTLALYGQITTGQRYEGYRNEGYRRIWGEPTKNGEFSAREIEVLQSLADGLESKDAAQRLGISPFTIKMHKTNISEKIGDGSQSDKNRLALALALVAQHGLVVNRLPQKPQEPLNSSEEKIVEYLLRGYDLVEIAKLAGWEKHNIYRISDKIRSKLGAATNYQVIAWAAARVTKKETLAV